MAGNTNSNLGISSGGSISPARPATMVITEGKSQLTEVGAVLPGEAEESETKEKRQRAVVSIHAPISVAIHLRQL